MARQETIALLLAAGVMLGAAGCEPQGQARLAAETPRELSPARSATGVELAEVNAGLAEARTKLAQAKGRTYDLESRIDSLERQLAWFDSQGLARAARKERETSVALTNEIASLQRGIDKARHDRDAPGVPRVTENREENPEDAIPLVEKIFGRRHHGFDPQVRTGTVWRTKPSGAKKSNTTNKNRNTRNNNRNNRNNTSRQDALRRAMAAQRKNVGRP